MPVYIHTIETAVPDNKAEQQHISKVMKEHLGSDRKTRAIIHRLYSKSGIKTRHSVLEDFSPGEQGSLFFNGEVKTAAGTGDRNKVYEKEATRLFVQTARKTLQQNPDYTKDDITHVISVSCTGFFAPGPDFEIVRQLDMKPETHRFHVGFMGCYAAFPALKMAESFCKSDPDAVVLVVCAELCSLHFQFNDSLDNLLSASVFADGAAGVILSQNKPAHSGFNIAQFATSLAPAGKEDMAWTIGDSGFNMVLSNYIPDIIEENISKVIQPLLNKYGLTADEISDWALHPGGRAILDTVQKSLDLSPKQLRASRKILEHYGNMSSPTVLFVLKDILDSNPESDAPVVPVAFGPGLTIESALFYST